MRKAIVLCVSAVLAGCASSAAGPIGIRLSRTTPEIEVTGVVNGLWRYDRQENRKRLEHDRGVLDETQIEEFSARYVVRVGIERHFVGGKFTEYALLPEGWR